MNSRCLRAFILSISLISCGAGVCAAVISMSMQFKKAEVNLTEFGNYIPQHFIVDSSYDSIVRSQGRRATSAVFSFVSYMEGLFHSFLVSSKAIRSNETVQFSEQAFAAFLKKNCLNPKYEKVCALLGGNFTLEGISLQVLLEVVQQMPEMESSLFPYSVCKYEKDNVDSYDCSDTLDASQNPIKFHIKDTTWITGIESIKELLYDTNKPVLFTMPELHADYYIPCDDERVKNKTECSSKTITCPYDDGLKCGIMSFPARTLSGDFFLPQSPVGVSAGLPMNFEIVGYSDSFIAQRGRAKLYGMKLSKGGFIVKGTTKEVGYPVTYLTGDLTSTHSFKVCPNWQASQHWAGPLLSCMLKENSELDACSGRAKNPDDDSETKYEQPDALECINPEYCEVGAQYTFTHQPVRTYETVVYEEKSGMTSTQILKLGTPNKAEMFNKVPFHWLGTVFRKKPDTTYASSAVCGYWFLPYDVVERAMAISNTYSSHVLAFSIDAEFKESSIPKDMILSEYATLFKKYSFLPARHFTSYEL